MAVGTSLFLIAVGAILAIAATSPALGAQCDFMAATGDERAVRDGHGSGPITRAVVDHDHLVGVVPLHRLIAADPGTPVRAIRSENVQAAAGMVGASPGAEKIDLQLSVNAQGRLQSEQEFGEIISRSCRSGHASTVAARRLRRPAPPTGPGHHPSSALCCALVHRQAANKMGRALLPATDIQEMPCQDSRTATIS